MLSRVEEELLTESYHWNPLAFWLDPYLWIAHGTAAVTLPGPNAEAVMRRLPKPRRIVRNGMETVTVSWFGDGKVSNGSGMAIRGEKIVVAIDIAESLRARRLVE